MTHTATTGWPYRSIGCASSPSARAETNFCQSFYTAPKPAGAYGPGHRNVCLEPPWPGYLILDVLHDDIVHIEVLYRTPLN
ncbi:hypothetical protein ACQEVZ_28710 [Dactylosporangium sp. CA-152071]|uniref:hypothetical protein n=1 Tax=Dactylosporangium sp. CA-152071 TaxID=3239933 RepID=UPI003D8CD5E5